MVKHVKWYVNTGKWSPTREEWIKLISSIAIDEADRVNKFAYKEDAKTALIGRALIRKFVSCAYGRASNEIKLTRNQYGRPEICKDYIDHSRLLDFNVSHSGDYCVLAGFWTSNDKHDHTSPVATVGIDVTKIVRKDTRQELNRFLDLMSRREFLPSEWNTVTQASDDRQKCINFTRLWCLKESFIKSLGLGLKFKLNRICFKPHESKILNQKNFINDTQVLLDGELANDWYFLETALDDDHLVAIGYNYKNSIYLPDENPFIEISINSLVNELASLFNPMDDMWCKFDRKLIKNK